MKISLRRALEVTGITLRTRLLRWGARLRPTAPADPAVAVNDVINPPVVVAQAALRHWHRAQEDQFIEGNFASASGERAYKLFVPASYRERGALIVMLHGCAQSPDDFARGTCMNQAAAAHGHMVLYPAQAASANAQKCWNWFQAADQGRDVGEPAIIAAMTRQVVDANRIDPARVFVAGLSAGGAEAAVLGANYPDIFAAIGVHSGLACGAARDVSSAMAAMMQGRAGRPIEGRKIPAIIFQGDRDATVHPDNADAVMAQWTPGGRLEREVEQGAVPGGRAWTRTCLNDARGRIVLEKWVVHGAGHAWSGGSAAGTFTDPAGPDATAEMMRFFHGVSEKAERPRKVSVLF